MRTKITLTELGEIVVLYTIKGPLSNSDVWRQTIACFPDVDHDTLWQVCYNIAWPEYGTGLEGLIE